MHREQGSRQPCSGYLEQSENSVEDKRAQAVQQNINEMIWENGIAPERVFNPENRMGERIILLGRSGLGPNSN